MALACIGTSVCKKCTIKKTAFYKTRVCVLTKTLHIVLEADRCYKSYRLLRSCIHGVQYLSWCFCLHINLLKCSSLTLQTVYCLFCLYNVQKEGMFCVVSADGVLLFAVCPGCGEFVSLLSLLRQLVYMKWELSQSL